MIDGGLCALGLLLLIALFNLYKAGKTPKAGPRPALKLFDEGEAEPTTAKQRWQAAAQKVKEQHKPKASWSNLLRSVADKGDDHQVVLKGKADAADCIRKQAAQVLAAEEAARARVAQTREQQFDEALAAVQERGAADAEVAALRAHDRLPELPSCPLEISALRGVVLDQVHASMAETEDCVLECVGGPVGCSHELLKLCSPVLGTVKAQARQRVPEQREQVEALKEVLGAPGTVRLGAAAVAYPLLVKYGAAALCEAAELLFRQVLADPAPQDAVQVYLSTRHLGTPLAAEARKAASALVVQAPAACLAQLSPAHIQELLTAAAPLQHSHFQLLQAWQAQQGTQADPAQFAYLPALLAGGNPSSADLALLRPFLEVEAREDVLLKALGESESRAGPSTPRAAEAAVSPKPSPKPAAKRMGGMLLQGLKSGALQRAVAAMPMDLDAPAPVPPPALDAPVATPGRSPPQAESPLSSPNRSSACRSPARSQSRVSFGSTSVASPEVKGSPSRVSLSARLSGSSSPQLAACARRSYEGSLSDGLSSKMSDGLSSKNRDSEASDLFDTDRSFEGKHSQPCSPKRLSEGGFEEDTRALKRRMTGRVSDP